MTRTCRSERSPRASASDSLGPRLVAEQHSLELGSSAVDAALHRADLARQHRADLLVRQPVQDGQDQNFAVRRAELAEGASKLVNLDGPFLGRGHAGQHVEVEISLLRVVILAVRGAEKTVAQDGKQPRLEIRAGRELVFGPQSIDHGVLDQIVRERHIPTRQAARIGPQLRQQFRQVVTEQAHSLLPTSS